MQKGFRSAGDEIKNFSSRVAGFATAAAAAAGIALTADALKNYVVGTIEAISETNILAQRVGFSTEGFQRLAYAAKLAHMDGETLATSLGQMSRRLGEVAIEGSGPAADALKRFGLNARVLAAMGPEKAFGVLVGVMERIQNPMERSSCRGRPVRQGRSRNDQHRGARRVTFEGLGR